ncbi:MAG TPA: TolC family protein, partial [Methylomirabilota bacterium]|nr:TolC family protein [Methylomirabilota bacterium]
MMRERLTPSLALALTLALLPSLALAQTPPPTTPLPPAPPPAVMPTPPSMPPREPLRPPPGIRPFATPQELVGRELGLEEAVNIGLENAPLIVARIGDYIAAQQRVNQALAPLLPQLTGSGSYGRLRGLSTVSGDSSINDFGSASVTASQLLFDFGRTWAAKDAAKSNAAALKEVLETQKLDISQLVKTQYFTLLLSKRLVQVNLAALDRAEVNLRSAQGFFQVGTQPKSFVTRAEVDVANARVNVIRAQNAVNLARVALNAAMGIAVNAPTEVKDLLSYAQFPINRDDLIGEALRNRPEYRQVKAQADAADATVRQTFRDFFPNLFGSGTYGVAGVTGSP